MKRSTPRTRIWLVGINLLLVVAVAMLFVPESWIPGLIRYGSMPILATLLVLFFAVLIRQLRRLPKEAFEKRYSKGIVLLLLVAAGFQLVHEDFGYKILMDEYILTATSMNMHFEKSAYTPTRGRVMQGEFEVVEGYIDKRPFLYPFLLSLVHDMSGYRMSNPFILNTVLNVLLFLVIYLAGFHLGAKRGGILAVLLLAGLPLLAQNATGAGFELLNFLLLSLTVYLTLSLTARPGLDKETLLVLAAILLANVRYESVIFLLPVALIIGLRWRANPQLGPGWITVWSPWFLAPLLIQNRWFRSQESLWELPGEVSAPFSLSYIPENVGHAAVYFFNTGAEFPNSLLLTIVGFVALFFLLVAFAKRFGNWIRLQPRDFDVLGLWGIVLLGHLLLILAYHIGKLDSHFATRLGWPIHLILVLAPVWLLVKEKMHPRYWHLTIAAAALFVVTFSAPHSSHAIFTKKNFTEREFRWAYEVLKTEPDAQFLIIDSRLTHWICRQWQAENFERARVNSDRILKHLNKGVYREVYVIQRITYDPVEDAFLVDESDKLPDLNLEYIDEFSSKPFSGVRVSRVSKNISE